jgi:ACR3 family arsenite efflux pump ArsB
VRGKDLNSMGTFSKQRLERQKGQQWAGDKMMPEIGQIAVYKAHLLSQ